MLKESNNRSAPRRVCADMIDPMGAGSATSPPVRSVAGARTRERTATAANDIPLVSSRWIVQAGDDRLELRLAAHRIEAPVLLQQLQCRIAPLHCRREPP